jgi:hypothetical protein
MTLAAAGYLHPVAAALLMVVSSFTVSWRALRGAECDSGCVTDIALADDQRIKDLVGTDRLNLAGKIGRLRGRNKPALWALNSPLVNCLLVVAQAPFLVRWGNIIGFEAVGVWLVLVLLGLGMLWWRPRHRDLAHVAAMSWAMLGWGNWGMVLGWWYDAGFGTLCAGCLSHATSGVGWHSLVAMPGMNVGMLLLGLPPMLVGPNPNYRGLGRMATGIFSGIGMLWGMNLGGQAASRWFHFTGLNPVLISFAGMTVGMLLGMFLFCEAARAWTVWRTRKSLAY